MSVPTYHIIYYRYILLFERGEEIYYYYYDRVLDSPWQRVNNLDGNKILLLQQFKSTILH